MKDKARSPGEPSSPRNLVIPVFPRPASHPVPGLKSAHFFNSSLASKGGNPYKS